MLNYLKPHSADWTTLGEHVPVVGSTNAHLHSEVVSFARKLEPLAEGYSIRADLQTQGRGRHNRVWEGASGENLYVTYALSAQGLDPTQLFTLSQNLALVVRDFVESATGHLGCRVKWPNDVMVGSQKVAGLLLESTLAGSQVGYVAAGMGLNVNQVAFEYAPSATSLALLAGRRFDVQQVWRSLTQNLQVAMAHLRDAVRRGDLYPVQHEYNAQLFGIGQLGRYQESASDNRFNATLKGVTPRGLIRLNRAGEELTYNLDEIKFETFIAPS